MDKALHYLSLARKAGLAELGEEPAGAAARAGKAHLIVVASDAGDHTWRRACSYVAGTAQKCIRVDATKDALGQAIGRTSLAIAALTDVSLALALVQALDRPERYGEALESLKVQKEKAKKRQAENKAHKRNVRMSQVKK